MEKINGNQMEHGDVVSTSHMLVSRDNELTKEEADRHYEQFVSSISQKE